MDRLIFKIAALSMYFSLWLSSTQLNTVEDWFLGFYKHLKRTLIWYKKIRQIINNKNP